jgi:hypothetical protein
MSEIKLDTKAEFIAKFVLARASEGEYDSDWISHAEDAWSKMQNTATDKPKRIPFDLDVFLSNKNMKIFTRNGCEAFVQYFPDLAIKGHTQLVRGFHFDDEDRSSVSGENP